MAAINFGECVLPTLKRLSCFASRGVRSSAKGDIGLETTRDLNTSKTRYWTARWPGRPSPFLRMRALDLTRLKVTLPLTPSIGLMESMSKGQMTTFKEKLQALHDALSDAYDEDQENEEQHAEKQHENPIGR